jgi:hypothetical protein
LEAKHPEFQRNGQLHLPRFKRAQKGWKKLVPCFARDAIPEELNFAVSGYHLWKGRQEAALINATEFSTYGRPSAIQRLSTGGLITPDNEEKHYILLLDPREAERPNKTGMFDNSVVLDDSRLPCLGTLLHQHAIQREVQATKERNWTKEGPPLPMWAAGAAKAKEEFEEATRELKVQQLLKTRYQNRHGGPSRDKELKLRETVDVQKRGHWEAASSVRNYEKHGRVQMMRKQLGSGLIAYGELVRKNFFHFYLNGTCPKPPQAVSLLPSVLPRAAGPK